ncbi:MAG: HU family DNA-binding protein [Chloroflexota bacterium]|nr:HU family DNA-binding protein [Chloroflexota bacterium]MDE2895785.1 HU family DNA-binding protein [Chloroflexota bacterium]
MNKVRAKTKTELIRAIAARIDLSAGEVGKVRDALSEQVLDELSAGGPGAVTVAGLIRAEVVAQPARSERTGRNPATGATITIAARPARERGKVRLRPLKPLRDVL